MEKTSDLAQAVGEVQALQGEGEVITTYKDIIYKTTNGDIGSTSHMLQKNGPFGKTNKFSDHLSKAGNYVNNGLNTVCDRDRYHD